MPDFSVPNNGLLLFTLNGVLADGAAGVLKLKVDALLALLFANEKGLAPVADVDGGVDVLGPNDDIMLFSVEGTLKPPKGDAPDVEGVVFPPKIGAVMGGAGLLSKLGAPLVKAGVDGAN